MIHGAFVFQRKLSVAGGADFTKSGHDVLTIQETGRAGQAMTDEAVLAFASAANRAVPTLNRNHFIRLDRISSNHGEIIVCTFDRDFEAQALRIHAAVSAVGDLAGQVVRVNRV